jgi:hypothetical protein
MSTLATVSAIAIGNNGRGCGEEGCSAEAHY